MARYPLARYSPLGTQTQPKMSAHDIICFHTMVGTLDGTGAMFKKSGYTGTESHFGTGPDGTVIQWQDTIYTADANLDGNWHVISIENADWGAPFPSWDDSGKHGDQVPAFTDHQVETLITLGTWLCKEHNIPPALIPDTKRGRRGLAYHAQGVPGNGLVSGGEVWSSAYGKVCPGAKRIAQIKSIIVPGIAARVNGEPPMAKLDADDYLNIAKAVLTYDGIPAPARTDTKANPNWTLSSYIRLAGEWTLTNRDLAQQILKLLQNPSALADQLAPKLPTGVQVSKEDLEAALRDVFGSLDNNTGE